MNNDKAKAEILDWCCQRVECLARRKVLDLVGTLDAPQIASSVSEEEIDASGAPHSGIRRFSPETETLPANLRKRAKIAREEKTITADCDAWYFEQSADEIERLRGHAPTPAVTDAMCEAAVKADRTDRIQGFSYNTDHVIRDVYKAPGEQVIWRLSKEVPGSEDKFYHQCRIERMRKVLEAALSITPPVREGE